MAIKTLSEVATLANVERLPRPVKARTRENVVACIANGDGANRVNGMDVPGTGGACHQCINSLLFTEGKNLANSAKVITDPS
jgi:hypothetical protein